MKLGLLGYGKMGRRIEEIAMSRGHQVVLKVDEHSPSWTLDEVDLAIDFSTPEIAYSHIQRCLDARVPVVSGTTGWLAYWDAAVQQCHETNGSLLYASNFSLGVHLFFELNRRLARLMAQHPVYGVKLQEIHHIHKKDSPSGTAISLTEDIIRESAGLYEGWKMEASGPLDTAATSELVTTPDGRAKEIPIYSERQGEVPGIHRISYASEVDCIRIEHEAFSRDGFALGAVIGAEWLLGKSGVFSMKDVLGL